MNNEPTLPQGDPERHRSEQLSVRRGTPPAQIPGYEFERFLGEGAYGEVWVAVEKNTGRRVAVKFYTRGGGLDWSLLAREVEKLAFLFADRYVVQLIGVGWDADPPYYVMEYMERGSLAERLQDGPLSVAEAVAIFQDVAVGLVHSHQKGVLHCDLKPANVLLDQDGKPRLADFGQSRLSHEQVPALGTLFYMAPEQADMKAVPDARWDVYALGALAYCMLTGNPPHRTPEALLELDLAGGLEQRLAAYRRWIRKSPPPSGHRQVAGVDRELAEIIDRCLAADPRRRYANVQVVLDALSARTARRQRRPILVVGALGPMLLLAVVAAFAWQGFSMALNRFENDLVTRALENNRLNALRVAGSASKELQRRRDAVEQVAATKSFAQAVAATMEHPEIKKLADSLSDPRRSEADLEPLREEFRRAAPRQALQRHFEAILPAWMPAPRTEGGEEEYEVASWFFCDARGLSTVRAPESKTIGKNYAWRSFFHGGPADEARDWRPPPGHHLKSTTLSAVFRSEASMSWIVAVASPVFDPSDSGKFLGVVALTVRAARFVKLEGDEDQKAVLVDLRPGQHTGMILQHPLFDEFIQANQRLPEHLKDFRLAPNDLPITPEVMRNYRDPLARTPEGRAFDRHWLACLEPIRLSGREAGWAVIVQESYDTTIGSALADLRNGLIRSGAAAVGMIVVVLLGMWGLALRMLYGATPLRRLLPSALGLDRSATATTPMDTARAPAIGQGQQGGRIGARPGNESQ
jgi:hypothetical protein